MGYTRASETTVDTPVRTTELNFRSTLRDWWFDSPGPQKFKLPWYLYCLHGADIKDSRLVGHMVSWRPGTKIAQNGEKT